MENGKGDIFMRQCCKDEAENSWTGVKEVEDNRSHSVNLEPDATLIWNPFVLFPRSLRARSVLHSSGDQATTASRANRLLVGKGDALAMCETRERCH